MTLRFSNDGPEFPSEFVDSLLAGEVVFLCGTGVSAPQMPDFRRLVERTFEALRVEKTASEQIAFKIEHFEEVLGSLSRRLVDPDAVTRTVSELLAVPEHPCIDQHRTILRLSRDIDSRISVVTTNFDTLLERAASQIVPNETPGDISFAGQALPAPGSSSFSGIIHIHGRLADRELGLEHSQLVLTSADYGDAYMRSGWASRFLFDLARCKAIVLVGYSANDAPVRYFLNVLEADRTRFPDLKAVYAFDPYETDAGEATRPWGTLAVMPLPYRKVNPDTGQHDHSPLWCDLAALAEIAERPKRLRRKRASAILERPVADADADSRRELAWLLASTSSLSRASSGTERGGASVRRIESEEPSTRRKSGARAGPIWHYAALRGTRSTPTCSGGGLCPPGGREHLRFKASVGGLVVVPGGRSGLRAAAPDAAGNRDRTGLSMGTSAATALAT